jgi:hypothetical protein
MTMRIGIAAVFLVGCAVGGASSQLVVPKASAQQAAQLPRWENTCFSFNDVDGMAGLVTEMNKLGAQRWEYAGGGDVVYCFKRSKM